MLGSNVPAIGGYHEGIVAGQKWGCESIQIYITPSRTWTVKPLSSSELERFAIARETSNVRAIVAHVPFLVNLATPDIDLRQRSIERLSLELDRARQLGVSYLVLHPGSGKGEERSRSLDNVVDALRQVYESENDRCPVLALECMSGQGTVLGSSFEELDYILTELNRDDLGICFDTAHVFQAGYDIRGSAGYQKVMASVVSLLGLEAIKVFHLNDSLTPLGSKKDLHACIGEGKIGIETFRALVNDSRFIQVPKILEMPERDSQSPSNLRLLKSLRSTQR